MEQLTMDREQRVWPIHIGRSYIVKRMVVIEVEPAEQETAAKAALMGIAAYNADPTFLDPAANKEGPSPRGKATSKRAALDNWPRSGSQRRRILEFMLDGDGGGRRTGATREEIAGVLGLSGDTVRPRVLELLQGGWVIETEHTRPTRKGNDSVVLLASQKAVEYRG